MRCNPSYWLLGVVPIAALSWLAVQLEHDAIESDLGRRAQESLARQGLDWATPNFSGRDGVVTGRAIKDSDPAKALSAVRDIWGVRLAQGRTDLIELAEKFTWVATSEAGGQLRLSGYVPSEDARKSVLSTAQALFANHDIADETRLARGAPDQGAWLGGALFGLKQLAQLKSGTAELDALDLSVTGQAPTVPVYRNVTTALKSKLPGGVKLAFQKITPPTVDPYVWTAKWAANQLSITGYAPSEKVRGALDANAKALFPKAQLIDKSDIADGAPENWTDAAALALSQLARLKTGAADIKGRDVTLAGEAQDETTAQAIRKAMTGTLPATYQLIDQIKFPRTVPATTGGYVMAISQDGSAIEVSGFVPSEAARAALIDAVKARFPGQTVTDRTQIVAGAPDGWQQCLVAGLAVLPKLKTGKITLNDRKLSVTGATDDYGLSQTAPGDIRTAAGQTCETDTAISFTGEARTDLSWRGAHNADGSVLLDGEIPDESSRTRVVEFAERLFPRSRVSDQMKVAPAPAEPWLSFALTSLEQLAKLQSGEAALTGKNLLLRGIATSDAAAAAIRQTIASATPQGFAAKDEIQVVIPDPRQQEADRCTELMQDATARGTLQFARAKANLTPDSTGTLRELAEIANACPSFRISIEGHTDAEGTDERNQRLSDRRAQAVADFLARSGVDRTRLTTTGYGSSRPIAENTNEQGRAKNRRIEFIVKVN